MNQEESEQNQVDAYVKERLVICNEEYTGGTEERDIICIGEDSCKQVTDIMSISSSVMRFYPRDAMLARVIEIATCLSVCLSVRLSVRHAPVLCQNEES